MSSSSSSSRSQLGPLRYPGMTSTDSRSSAEVHGVQVIRWARNSANNRVLNVLKSVYLSLRKVKEQKVSAVQFGMYNRCADGVGCFAFNVETNTLQRS